jgi:WD40 repeat protein
MRADLKRLKRERDSGRLASVGESSALLTSRTRAEEVLRPGARSAPPSRRRTEIAVASIAAIFAGAVLAHWLMRPLPPPKITGSVQITTDGRAKFAPTLTDGSRLYFMVSTGNGAALYQVSIAGGEAAPISTPFSFFAALAGISPDGSELLVQSWEGSLRDGPLWVCPALAGPRHRLGDILASSAGLSPDGQTIVYAKGNDLYLAKSDGTGSRKLVATSTVLDQPCWSPDQTKVRFTARDPKTQAQSLWEVSADGTNLHPLLPFWNNPPAESSGSWTSDGKYFVFQSTRKGRTDIWAIREKGEFLHKANRTPMQLTTGPLNFSGPVASKDGKRIFVIGSQPRGELLRYEAKAGQFVPYLGGISATDVSFSRDGQWVVYVAYPEGTLWRSRVDGGERLQLSFPPL